MLLLAVAGGIAQPAPGSASGIRIVPRTLEVRDDSVRISLEIRASGIRIPSDESLSLIPELQQGEKQVVLPAVVLSGAERARFDRREEAVNPDRSKPLPYHVWSGVRRGNNYLLNYQISLPYASWMQHASLRLRQISRDCCTEQLLANDVLTKDINLLSAVALPAEAPALSPRSDAGPQEQQPPPAVYAPDPAYDPDPLPLRSDELQATVTVYLSYPSGRSSVVNPSWGRNREELQKVDDLLAPLLENPAVTFREIRITSLSESRAEGFRLWLVRAYGLQDYPLTTVCETDDGEGVGRIEVYIIYNEE